jgi:hypothetical protein
MSEEVEQLKRELAEARFLSHGRMMLLNYQEARHTKERETLAKALELYAWNVTDEELAHHCGSPNPRIRGEANRERKRRTLLATIKL